MSRRGCTPLVNRRRDLPYVLAFAHDLTSHETLTEHDTSRVTIHPATKRRAVAFANLLTLDPYAHKNSWSRLSRFACTPNVTKKRQSINEKRTHDKHHFDNPNIECRPMPPPAYPSVSKGLNRLAVNIALKIGFPGFEQMAEIDNDKKNYIIRPT